MISFRSLSRKKPKPRVPKGIRIYAIGDIHGRVDLLDDVLERIDTDRMINPTSLSIEVYLGDYIDRGPASREVLDRLVARKRSFRGVFLKGNHESYLTNFPTNPSLLEDWQRYGGLETLASYGITPTINAKAAEQVRLAAALDRALPKSHREFLSDLKSSFTCGDFFFVHAGVRPDISLAKQREEDLLWIRRDFLMSEDDFGKIIVHGHTPVLQPEIRQNRINIDTGAYATGRLTCLKLEDTRIEFI
jgi:serine/threonine protein phosphatase 1